MPDLSVEQALRVAVQHQQAGQLPQAESLYRQILAQQPNHVDALHLLGVIAAQVGRNDVAVDLIGRAIALDPNSPAAHNNFGNALRATGQLDRAIVAYRQAIALQSGCAEAHHNLGVTLRHKGQFNEAIAACRQAVALKPNYPDAWCNLGIALADKGRPNEATAAYRQAIAFKPDYAEAHSNLGNALKDLGQLDEAIAAYRQAIALKPNYPEAHSNLGNALAENGRIDESIAACRQAIALKSDLPEAYINLGNALTEKGAIEEAIAAYHQALALTPNSPNAHSNLGNVLRDAGQLDEAIAACRQAIALKPDFPEAYVNLANALRETGHLDEAIAACQQTLALAPNSPKAYSNLGNILRDAGQLDASIAACRQAIALKPNLPEAHVNLGLTLGNKGQLDESLAASQRAIALKPNCPEAYNNLGNTLKDLGQLEAAIAAYRQAIARRPNFANAHSNLVLAMHYHPAYDAQAIAEEHRRWNLQHAEPLKQYLRPHSNSRDPDRRLRIGYVSPDFREHPVGRFLLPVLTHHDKNQFEVFAYSQVLVPDAMTFRLRSYADGWRSTVGLSDAQVADLIRQDRIDILVDLAGHTAHNRLLVFARKPAPIQVTWLGYPDTTGLNTIDYRLTDAYADPPGTTDALCTEQLVRLPQTAWCFDPPDSRPVPPRAHSAAITFGSFNNFAKVTEAMLRTWGRLLQALPEARLLIKASSLADATVQQRVRQIMREAGVAPNRVELRGWDNTYQEHLASYAAVDIVLDTFPYHGTTTTCEALWMGIPVITLAGQTHVSRVGVSLLHNVGLPELVARSEAEYLRIACELANHLPRLRELRSTLRQRMEQSRLMDAPRFTRDIEAAYAQMWRGWCAEVPALR